MRVVFLVCAFLWANTDAWAGDKPEELIVGKWEHLVLPDSRTYIVEWGFTKDNKFTWKCMVTEWDLPKATTKTSVFSELEGTYRIIDGTVLEMTAKEGKGPVKFDLKVTKDELVITDRAGEGGKAGKNFLTPAQRVM